MMSSLFSPVASAFGRFRRGAAPVPAVDPRDPQAKVRANSRAVWNEWVGGWRFRERVAFGAMCFLAVVVLCDSIAIVREAGKPTIPPVVITVDKFGQVVDVSRPVPTTMSDNATRHFLGLFVMNTFGTNNSATALTDQYTLVRDMWLEGSSAEQTITSYWNKYSPLRKMADGTLQIPVAPREFYRIHVTSYLPQGRTTDGAELWELEWTSQAIQSDGSAQAPILFRGRIAFQRRTAPPSGLSDQQIADFWNTNPFGIAVEELTWDNVQ
jgi:type IV secretory pathway TrbF-like protein